MPVARERERALLPGQAHSCIAVPACYFPLLVLRHSAKPLQPVPTPQAGRHQRRLARHDRARAPFPRPPHTAPASVVWEALLDSLSPPRGPVPPCGHARRAGPPHALVVDQRRPPALIRLP